MKILLLGKNGQLGWELQRSLAPLGELIALDRHSQDFCGDLTNLQGLAAKCETTWNRYAKHVIAQAERAQTAMKIIAKEVACVSTSAFSTPARRPHNSRLNTAKLQATFGLTLPAWQLGVDRMLAEVLVSGK